MGIPDQTKSHTRKTDPQQVFLSYRREGGYEMTRLIYDALKSRGYRPFMDVEGLKNGVFSQALLNKIDEASDFVVILSPGSLDRCVDPEDWLRKELAHAIRQQKNIVPVIMRSFRWPSETLPDDIKRLPDFNGLEPSRELFEASMEKLCSLITFKPVRRSRFFSAVWVVAALTVCLAGWQFFANGGEERSITVEPTSRDVQELTMRMVSISALVGLEPLSISKYRIELLEFAARTSTHKRYAEDEAGSVAALYRLVAGAHLLQQESPPDRERLRQGVYWIERLAELNPELNGSLRLTPMRKFFNDYIEGRSVDWDAKTAAGYALDLALLNLKSDQLEKTKEKAINELLR